MELQSNYKRNLIMNTLDGAFISLGSVFIATNTMLPVLIEKLGGSNLFISLIPFISILGCNLPQFIIAGYLKKYEKTKPFVIVFGLGQRLPWLAVALACFIFGIKNSNLLVMVTMFALIVNALSNGLITPAWWNLFAKVTPVEIRGRVLSIRTAIGQVMGIVGAVAAAKVITLVAFPYNFGLLYLVGFFFMMISFTGTALVREPHEGTKTEAQGFQSFIKDIPGILKKDKNYRNYLVSRILFELPIAISAFYSVYAIKHFNLPVSYSAIFTSIVSVTYVAVNLFLGFIGDKKGNKICLVIGQICGVCASLAAILSNSIYMYYIVFIFIAAAESTKNLCIQSMTMEFCSQEQRPTYIAIGSMLTVPVSLLVLGAGSIADHFGYAPVFVLSAAITALALIVLHFKVKDPRMT